MRTLVKLIAAGRVLIGTALTLAPRQAARGWLGDAAEDPATQVAVRALGARDLALGLGVLLAIRRGRSPRGWVEAGILSDGVDAVATLAAWRYLPRTGRAMTLVVASGAVAAGIATTATDRSAGD